MGRIALFRWGKMSRKQKQVLTWWTEVSPVSDCEGIICDGSIRAGKTLCMAVSFVMWAMQTFHAENFAMCGKTVGSFRRNVLAVMKRALPQMGYDLQERRSDNLLIIRCGDRENFFYIFGGKDEASQDLIQGITLAGVFLDEVALMPESFVNQATGRCSVDGSKFWFNCNPANSQHWFKKMWIDQAESKNLLHLHFTMADNLTLGENIRQRYERQYAGVFYKRYILGLWVAAEGLVYDMFDENRHVVEDADTGGDFYVSCDYGIQNATVFLLWQKETESKRWVCKNEWYYSGREQNRQKTVGELVDGLKAMLGEITPKQVIVDPSAAALIVEMQRRGFKVRKADNDVLDGIADVGTLLQSDGLAFCKSCKGTINEFGVYAWDSKKADSGIDAPIKENDHGMDAVRYFVKTMKLVRKNSAKELSGADGYFL